MPKVKLSASEGNLMWDSEDWMNESLNDAMQYVLRVWRLERRFTHLNQALRLKLFQTWSIWSSYLSHKSESESYLNSYEGDQMYNVNVI